MIKIYETQEMPQEYIDAIKKHKVDVNKVEYIAVPNEQSHFTCYRLLGKISRDFTVMTTASGTSFYCLNKIIDN